MSVRMSATPPTKQLAITLINEYSVTAPLSAVEERVWMLKTRHMSDAQIRDIIINEFGASDTADDDPVIIVNDLPDEYQRSDWR